MRSGRPPATLPATQEALGASGSDITQPEETTMNTHEKNTWKTPLIKGMFALTLLAAVTGNAFAATTAGDRPIKVVQFADLNLQRPAGIAMLYKRIEVAANAVCDSSTN